MKIILNNLEDLEDISLETFEKFPKNKKNPMAVENSYGKFLSRKRDKKNSERA